jgi:hypothetical protein
VEVPEVRPLADVTPARWLAEALVGHGRSWEVGAVVPAGYPSYVEVVLEEGAFWRVCEVLGRHTAASAPCWYALWEGWPVPMAWQAAPRFTTPEGNLYLFSGSFADAEVVAVELVCAGIEQGTQVTHLPALSPETRAVGATTLRAARAHLPPSLWWPEDRAWVLGRHVDSDTVLLAGPEGLAADLLATPGLVVRPTTPDEPFRVEE